MLRTLLKLLVFGSVGYGIGILARQLFLGAGDESSDEFELVTVMEGATFRSCAHHLWSGRTTTVMGRLDLDLRDATLAPEGADLEVVTVLGGMTIRVPETWSVDMDGRALIGDTSTRVTPPETLPAEAPRLRVHARTLAGSTEIAAQPVVD